MNDEKIRALEEQIAALEKQWPAHSVPPAMLQKLDELEEALAEAKRERAQEAGSGADSKSKRTSE